jgi:hypothetical protein
METKKVIEKFDTERNTKWTGLNMIGIGIFSILGLLFLWGIFSDSELSDETGLIVGWLILSAIIWSLWMYLLSKIETYWDKKFKNIKSDTELAKDYKEGFIYTNSEIVLLFYMLSDLISGIAGGLIIAGAVVLGLLLAGNIISGISPMVIIGGLLVAILIQVSKDKN